ncbi:MAG: DUF2062 domain-containing protein [Peptococcaceae bacterium]
MRSIFRWWRFKWLTFLRLKDEPGSIAKAVAIGVAMDFLPTFGFGLIFAYIVALALRVNKVAAVLSAVFFKWAIPFFYLGNIAMGKVFINKEAGLKEIPSLNAAQGFFHFADWSELSTTFLLGSGLNAVIAGIITYFICLKFIEYRKKHKKPNKKLMSVGREPSGLKYGGAGSKNHC